MPRFLLSLFLLCSLTDLFAQGVWQQLPPMPAAGRQQIACFSLNGKAYVGCGAWPVRYDLWEFNPVSSSWSQCASFPGTGRGFPYCFSIGNKGYFGGGSDGWNNLSDHWEYNSTTNSWTQRSNFPGINVTECYGFAINGKGYVGGGGANNDCWEYDPVTDTWSQKMTTPGAWMGAVDRGAFVIYSKGYVVNSGGQLWEFDPLVNSWIQKAIFPGPARYGACGFGIDCMGFFGVGDQQPPGPLNDFWLYHQPSDTWTQMQNFPGVARVDAGTVVIGNEAFLFFGNTLNDAWKFIPPTCNALFITATTTSTPCNASTGSATANPMNGTAPYTFLWTPTNQTTQTATGLSQGVYTVSVTDANALTGSVSCQVQGPYTIATVLYNNNTACNSSNGSASVTASGGTAPYTFLWSTGATSQVVTGLAQGTYSVIVTDANGCTTSAWTTIGMNPGPPPIVISGDTSICSGESTFLSAFFNGAQTFQWQWSSGHQTINVIVSPTVTTTYTVTVTGGTCTSTGVITVQVIPIATPIVTGDTVICQGEFLTLNASNASTYLWSTGNTSSSITVSPVISQQYYVIGSNGPNCYDTAFINITVLPSPVATIQATQIQLSEPGQNVTLSAAGGGTYLWSTGATTDSILVAPTATTTYCVTVTATTGCADQTCVTIEVNRSCVPFIPTAFSPGIDGNNDLFRITDPCISQMHIMVYDRWGEKVFESKDRNFTWDGTYKGRTLDAAVFVYYLEGVLQDESPVKLKGNLTLVR